MRNPSVAVACLAFLLLGAGCASQHEPAAAPAAAPASGAAPARLGGLVPGLALAIAQQAARARGINVDAFANPQTAQLLIRNRRLCWTVVFVPKEGTAPAAGGPFTIFVDDQSGKTEFAAGTAKSD